MYNSKFFRIIIIFSFFLCLSLINYSQTESTKFGFDIFKSIPLPKSDCTDVDVFKGNAFLNDGPDFKILDVGNLSNPFFKGGYTLNIFDNEGNMLNIEGIKFDMDDFNYVLDGMGVHIIDVINPYNPIPVNIFDLDYDLWGIADLDLGVWNDTGDPYAFSYVCGDLGCSILDVSDVGNVWETGFFKTNQTCWGNYYQPDNFLCYLASGNNGGWDNSLQIVDVYDIQNPKLIGKIKTSYPTDVFVQNNFAYVADFHQGMNIFDVSNPTKPQLIGSYNTPDQAWDVFVKDNNAYIATWNGGLKVLDVSNPYSPKYLTTHNTDGNAQSLFVDSGKKYKSNGKAVTSNQIVFLANKTNFKIMGFNTSSGPTPIPTATPTPTPGPTEIKTIIIDDPHLSDLRANVETGNINSGDRNFKVMVQVFQANPTGVTGRVIVEGLPAGSSTYKDFKASKTSWDKKLMRPYFKISVSGKDSLSGESFKFSVNAYREGINLSALLKGEIKIKVPKTTIKVEQIVSAPLVNTKYSANITFYNFYNYKNENTKSYYTFNSSMSVPWGGVYEGTGTEKRSYKNGMTDREYKMSCNDRKAGFIKFKTLPKSTPDYAPLAFKAPIDFKTFTVSLKPIYGQQFFEFYN